MKVLRTVLSAGAAELNSSVHTRKGKKQKPTHPYPLPGGGPWGWVGNPHWGAWYRARASLTGIINTLNVKSKHSPKIKTLFILLVFLFHKAQSQENFGQSSL